MLLPQILWLISAIIGPSDTFGFICAETLKPSLLSLMRISLTFQRLPSKYNSLSFSKLSPATHLKASELNAVWICCFVLFGIACFSLLIQTVSFGSEWHKDTCVAREQQQQTLLRVQSSPSLV